MYRTYNATHEWELPSGNKPTTWWHISILTACLALFLLAAVTLGYVGAIAEYCWYSPNELNSCESYRTATAVIHGVGPRTQVNGSFGVVRSLIPLRARDLELRS